MGVEDLLFSLPLRSQPGPRPRLPVTSFLISTDGDTAPLVPAGGLLAPPGVRRPLLAGAVSPAVGCIVVAKADGS